MDIVILVDNIVRNAVEIDNEVLQSRNCYTNEQTILHGEMLVLVYPSVTHCCVYLVVMISPNDPHLGYIWSA